MSYSRINRLEAIWQRAYEVNSYTHSEVTEATEQFTFNAYAEACDKRLVCHIAGCYERTPDYVLCQTHRL